MNILKLAKQTLLEEYGLISFPGIYDPKFLSLISGTKRLIELTVNSQGSKRKVRSLRISYVPESMASTDGKNDITIPAWYCYKDALSKFFSMEMSAKQASEIALVLINGSSIHEALHVAYSGYLFGPDATEYYKKYDDKSLIHYLINVAEDLKNETIIAEYPSLFKFVNAKNEIFFNDNLFSKTLDNVNNKELASPKLTALETLVFYKRQSIREKLNALLDSLDLNEVVRLIRMACSPDADVLNIADELYKIFVDTTAKEKTFFEEIQSTISSELRSAINNADSSSSKKVESLVELSMADDVDKIPPIEIIDVMSERFNQVRERWQTIHPSPTEQDFRFIKRLRLVRQVVPTMSEPKLRGSKLMNTRLSHIVMDGKIFTHRGESVASMIKRQPEFVILIDASGSMYGRLIEMVLPVVEKMSSIMVEDNVSHTVLAHTSISGSNDTPVLYHIFTNKMNGKSDLNHDERFKKMSYTRLCENLDGIALEAASKFFSQGKRRVMIVLSDGEPSSPNYDNGKKHTKDMIWKLRKDGVTIISLSLTKTVISANNDLYSEKFNIDSTDQNKLESGLMKLLSS